MALIRITLRPLTAFGTPLAGDTLFGQLCWAVRERYGNEQLTALLIGYTTGEPYLVVSDGFPAGFIPKPVLPEYLQPVSNEVQNRKALKRRAWLPASDAGQNWQDWLARACDPAEADNEATPGEGRGMPAHGAAVVVTHNTINRLTGTTGGAMFAPRQVKHLKLGTTQGLDLYAVIDESRFTALQLLQVLRDVGLAGYGRDASTGLGKFAVGEPTVVQWPVKESHQALTLAACAPVPAALDSEHCYYHPQTRFGRHGNLAVMTGNPFKRPILTLKTGALLTFRRTSTALFHGSGLGGITQPISTSHPETVHQGYAPLVLINSGAPT